MPHSEDDPFGDSSAAEDEQLSSTVAVALGGGNGQNGGVEMDENKGGIERIIGQPKVEMKTNSPQMDHQQQFHHSCATSSQQQFSTGLNIPIASQAIVQFPGAIYGNGQQQQEKMDPQQMGQHPAALAAWMGMGIAAYGGGTSTAMMGTYANANNGNGARGGGGTSAIGEARYGAFGPSDENTSTNGRNIGIGNYGSGGGGGGHQHQDSLGHGGISYQSL